MVTWGQAWRLQSHALAVDAVGGVRPDPVQVAVDPSVHPGVLLLSTPDAPADNTDLRTHTHTYPIKVSPAATYTQHSLMI